MPDGSDRTPIRKVKNTFKTLEREEAFRNPTKSGSTVPILNEFVIPHIESFNALFDDSGLDTGDGDGRGLLSLGLDDIGERVVFDGNGQVGSESGQTGWGNRLKGALPPSRNRRTCHLQMNKITSVDRASINWPPYGPRKG